MHTSVRRVLSPMRPVLLLTIVAAMVGCGPGTPTSSPGATSPGATAPDGDSSPTDGASPTPTQGLAEMTTVTYYVGGITSTAPQTHAGFVQGIFEEHNIDLEFVILDGTSQAVQAVAAHGDGFAAVNGSILDVMLVRDNEPSAPELIAIAELAPLNPVAVLFLEDSGIETPADLEGKTIGVPTGSLSETYLNVFLEQEGVSRDSVNIQNIGFAALHPALLQGQVDAIAEFARGIASMQVVAEEEGRSVGYFLFGEYDIPSPLTGVVVQKSLVDENPAVAQAIAAAEMESLAYCATQQEQCIEDFLSQAEGRDFDATLAEWQLALEAQYGLDAETVEGMEPLELGWFDPELVADTVPRLTEVFEVGQTFDPTSLYTNEFVQQP